MATQNKATWLNSCNVLTCHNNISNIICPWILAHVSLISFCNSDSDLLILQLDPTHLGPPTPSNSLTPLNLPLHFQLPPTNLSHREHTEGRLLKRFEHVWTRVGVGLKMYNADRIYPLHEQVLIQETRAHGTKISNNSRWKTLSVVAKIVW